MSDKRLLDTERVVRAIFLPAMLDSNGKVSLAAFTLRHNEGYFSVARMAVEGWLDDLKRIPSSATRQLGGYCKMGVGDDTNQTVPTCRPVVYVNDNRKRNKI